MLSARTSFEEAEAYKEDGTLLFKVVAHAFDQGLVDRAYERLKTVKGDCTTRGRCHRAKE